MEVQGSKSKGGGTQPLQTSLAGVPNCNTPGQNLLIWPSSACGTSLHTRNTSLALSSTLRVKGSTRRCYIWNDKDYKLAITLLNF